MEDNLKPKGEEFLSYKVVSSTYKDYGASEAMYSDTFRVLASESLVVMRHPDFIMVQDTLALDIRFDERKIFLVDSISAGFGISSQILDTAGLYGTVGCAMVDGMKVYSIDAPAQNSIKAYEYYMDENSVARRIVLYSANAMDMGNMLEADISYPRMEFSLPEIEKRKRNEIKKEILTTSLVVVFTDGTWQGVGEYKDWEVFDLRTKSY